MEKFFKAVRDWSEVWALFIPLLVIALSKTKNLEARPIKLYVILAFFINLAATVLFVFHEAMPSWLRNNNVLYNLHSITRVVLLGYFINSVLRKQFSTKLDVILVLYIACVLTDFLFIDNPFYISTLLIAVENIILLMLTLLYFFKTMQDESGINWMKHPSFFVCAGLGLYEAISFFIFLFYYNMDWNLGKFIFTVHNTMFVVLCILLAVALYKWSKAAAISRI